MNQRAQKFWVWCGVFSIVAFTIGWVGLEGFLPPLSPSASAQETAHEFASRLTGIRLGAIVMIVGTMFWVPWAAVVAAQTSRSEGSAPVNAWSQIGSAAVATAAVIMSQMFWVVAAFRPGRSAEITQALSDMGFICAIMPFIIFVVWNLAVAWSIVTDERDEPAYPRWAAYLSLWTALLYIPGGCLAFFHDGPFAWNGALAFYLPAAAFFLWFLVMTVLALKAIGRNASQAPTSPAEVRSASLSTASA